MYHRIIRCCLVTIDRHLNRVENSSCTPEEKALYTAWLNEQLEDVKSR